LAHGNRGSKVHNALDDGLKRRVLELAQSTYADCNTQHFTELLAECGGIAVSRSVVRLILLRVGLRNPRKKLPPKHRSRREHYRRKGMLLQMMPTNCRLSYIRANAKVHERINGSLAVYYKEQCLLTRSAPPEAPVLRVRNTARFIRGASDSREPAAYQLRPQRQRLIVLIRLSRIIRGVVLSKCVSIGGDKIAKQLG